MICCGALLGMVTPLVAGVDYFLKISGIPGEISDGAFAGWTRLAGLSATMARPVPASPDVVEKSVIGVQFSKNPGPLSAYLFTRCANGQTTPKIVLTCVEDSKSLLRVTLGDVVVSSFQSATLGAPPLDDIVCRFRTIEWSYALHDGMSGGQTAVFNVDAQAGALKPRVPFRALLEQKPETPGELRLTCPVEAGHRYRVVGNTSLSGRWDPVHEFSAQTDGIMDMNIPRPGPLLFLRVEEVE